MEQDRGDRGPLPRQLDAQGLVELVEGRLRRAVGVPPARPVVRDAAHPRRDRRQHRRPRRRGRSLPGLFRPRFLCFSPRYQQRDECPGDQDGTGSVDREAGREGRRGDSRQPRLRHEGFDRPALRVCRRSVQNPRGVNQEVEPAERARDGLGCGVDGRGARDVEREDRQARDRRGGVGGRSGAVCLGGERGEGGRRGRVAAGGYDGVEFSLSAASSQDELAGKLEAQAFVLFFGVHFEVEVGGGLERCRRERKKGFARWSLD